MYSLAYGIASLGGCRAKGGCRQATRSAQDMPPPLPSCPSHPPLLTPSCPPARPPEVHGANPVDHFVHRFTHRVVRPQGLPGPPGRVSGGEGRARATHTKLRTACCAGLRQ
jgi:hypothetical protein